MAKQPSFYVSAEPPAVTNEGDRSATVRPQDTLPPSGTSTTPAVSEIRENVPALSTGDSGHPSIAMSFERLASDPAVDVAKLERLMALWERNEARQAATAFHAAMSRAQAEMRAVGTDATNPETHSRYASYHALDRALRPIYTKHGFALSFNTGEPPGPDVVRVLCSVSHLAGHGQPYQVDMPADGKGPKGGAAMTKTHATGSAVTYGMRYLLKMIWNVAIGEDDDDGNRAGRREAVSNEPRAGSTAPAGFVDWWTDMEATASEGWPKLSAAWSKSKVEWRNHLMATNKAGWEALKAKAATVQA